MSVAIPEIVEAASDILKCDAEDFLLHLVPAPTHSEAICATNVAFWAPPKAREHVASRLANRFNSASSGALTANAEGSYVNFYPLDETYYTRVLADDHRPFRTSLPKRILVETAPNNIGEQFNLIHFRSAAICTALTAILRSSGDFANSVVFWNDCGTPAGRLLDSLLDLPRYSAACPVTESDFDQAIDRMARTRTLTPATVRARQLTLALEQGDAAVTRIWQQLREIQMERIKKAYAEMGYPIAEFRVESSSIPRIGSLVDQLLKVDRIFRDVDGSIIARAVSSTVPPKALLRNDGASLYLARDLVELTERLAKNWDQCLYVVSENQASHFSVLFSLAETLELSAASRARHVSFGLIDKRISVAEMVEAIGHQVVPTSPEQERKQLSVTLLKLFLWSRTRTKPVQFEHQGRWKSEIAQLASMIMSLNECRKILRANVDSRTEFTLSPHVKRLIVEIDLHELSVERARRRLDPYYVCERLLSVYRAYQLIGDDDSRSRALLNAYCSVTRYLLQCLGIPEPHLAVSSTIL